MMIQLLKKDWRVNRAPVIGAIAIFLAIYFIATLSVLLVEHQSFAELAHQDAIFTNYYGAGNVGLAATVLIAGAIGGISFTVERRERSSDFLGLLPVSRGQIVVSKTVVASLICLVMWAFNAGVVYTALRSSHYVHEDIIESYRYEVLTMLEFTGMTFGISWLLSTLLLSPTFACCIALALALGSNLIIALCAERLHYTGPAYERTVKWIFMCWSGGVGLASYVTGTIYYLRRVNP